MGRHFDYGVGTLYDRPFNAVRLYRACQRRRSAEAA